jgi:trigger factor
MQVSVETTSGLERRLTVGIPADVIDSEVDKRLQEAAKTVQIKGFRKGKVPVRVVKQRYGAGVRQEVLGDAINRSFYDAVRKESITPAGQPSIEPKQIEPGKDVEFVATFEVYPEIEIQGLDDIKVTRYDAEITETDVDNMITVLRKSQAGWEIAERAAQDGDRVEIDFVGTKDGEEFEGGSAQGHKLIIGSNNMIPGFEEGIIGMKPGEEKTLSLTFPEDYQVESLKGADTEFKVTLKSVSEQQLPELDEEFFKKFGVADGGIDKFRADVKDNMESEKSKAVKTKVKNQVMDALLKANKVDLPKALVLSEIDALRRQTLQQYGGLSKDLDVRSLLPDDMFREQAERRTALGLLISEVIKREKMTADKDRIRTLIEEQASTYEEPEAVVQHYYSNEQLLASVEAAALEDQVVEFVLDKATVTDKKVGYDEAIKPDQN